jgi:branched-chain amino acid transport system permease protein
MDRPFILVALAVALAFVPVFVSSDFWISWLTMVLFYAYLGQSWNILAGYGGQFSFGHALFFGVGAYATAILQIDLKINAWFGFVAAGAIGALVGASVGYVVFSRKLRGSYFALVTLAFAEVFRVIANTLDVTGAGVGLFLPSSPGIADLQFTQRAGFFWFNLALVTAAGALTWWIQHSRFGSNLVAVRESESAAQALGVRVLHVKIWAIGISGALAGTAGATYVQMYRFIDPPLTFGIGISIEALLGPIVGGLGTILGPVLGAFALHLVSEGTRIAFGEAAGLSLALYGALVIAIVLFVPDGLQRAFLRAISRTSRRVWGGCDA